MSNIEQSAADFYQSIKKLVFKDDNYLTEQGIIERIIKNSFIAGTAHASTASQGPRWVKADNSTLPEFKNREKLYPVRYVRDRDNIELWSWDDINERESAGYVFEYLADESTPTDDRAAHAMAFALHIAPPYFTKEDIAKEYALWPERDKAEQLSIADYEELMEDHRRIVREIDRQMNGENAAKQATLCDIQAQLFKELPLMKAEINHLSEMLKNCQEKISKSVTKY